MFPTVAVFSPPGTQSGGVCFLCQTTSPLRNDSQSTHCTSLSNRRIDSNILSRRRLVYTMNPNSNNHSAPAGFFARPCPLATAESSPQVGSSAAATPSTMPRFSTQAPAAVRSEDCAVNVWGWGIPIPDCVDRNNVTVLNASSNTQKYEELEQVYAQRAQYGPVGRSPFYFTAEELAEGGEYRYILVGFAIPFLGKEYRRVAPSNRAGTGNTGTDPNTTTLVPGVSWDALVMVVSEVQCMMTQYARFYALLDGPSGLCEPHLARFEHWYVRLSPYCYPSFRLFFRKLLCSGYSVSLPGDPQCISRKK